MTAGFWSRLSALLAVLCLVAASSGGQRLLFGDFHSWSLFSAETLTFGTLVLALAGLAAWLRRLHERNTQIVRDKRAAEILARLSGGGEPIASDLPPDSIYRRGRESAFAPKLIAVLVIYTLCGVWTWNLFAASIDGPALILLAAWAAAMLIGFVCALVPRWRAGFRAFGGIAMLVNVGCALVATPLLIARSGEAAILVVAVYLVGGGFAAYYILTQGWIDRARSSGSFVLYLRPFSSDRVLVSNPFRSRIVLVPSHHLEAEQIPLGAFLTRVCRMPLIQVGGSSDNPGPGKISTQDEFWQQRIELLLPGARAIVVTALHSAATAWEMEQLVRRGLLQRATLVVPARATLSAEQIAAADQMVGFFRDLGLELPPAGRSPMAVWYQDQGKAVRQARLSKHVLRRRLAV
jgi:hypothetical protein